MALGRSIAVVLVIALVACSTAPKVHPPTGFSAVDTEAYLVLMDQIVELTPASKPAKDAGFCVAVYTDDDPEGFHTERAFVERLRVDAPENFKAAALVPISDCVNSPHGVSLPGGRTAFTLFASNRDLERGGIWMAGYSCGALCGQGSFYAIDRASGQPVAKRIGDYVN